MGHPLSIGDHSVNVPQQIQKFTKRRFKLKARTRLILVLLGSIAMVTSWFLPWYVVDYFLSPSAFQTAMQSGHYDALAELDGAPQDIKLYGTNIVQIQYNGTDLAKAGFINLNQTIIYGWLGLLGLALLAVKVDEWPNYRSAFGPFLKKIIDGGKVLYLLLQAGGFLWLAVQATSRGLVHNAATSLMVHDLGSSSGILHIEIGLSVGLISLALGFLLASIGVFAGDKSEATNEYSSSRWPSLARLTAGACIVIGLIYFAISLALFL